MIGLVASVARVWRRPRLPTSCVLSWTGDGRCLDDTAPQISPMSYIYTTFAYQGKLPYLRISIMVFYFLTRASEVILTDATYYLDFPSTSQVGAHYPPSQTAPQILLPDYFHTTSAIPRQAALFVNYQGRRFIP